MPSSGVQTCADRKSTRLNSSHGSISYAVFCLQKKAHLRGPEQSFASANDLPNHRTAREAARGAGLGGCVGVEPGIPGPSALVVFFFFNDTATTEIYTLSLHDALPISRPCMWGWHLPSKSIRPQA